MGPLPKVKNYHSKGVLTDKGVLWTFRLRPAYWQRRAQTCLTAVRGTKEAQSEITNARIKHPKSYLCLPVRRVFVWNFIRACLNISEVFVVIFGCNALFYDKFPLSSRGIYDLLSVRFLRLPEDIWVRFGQSDEKCGRFIITLSTSEYPDIPLNCSSDLKSIVAW